MLDEDPTFQPKVNDKSKFLQRASSTGNISIDLYNQALERRERDKFNQGRSIMSVKASQYSSVLHNAGLSEGVSNSDKFFASKL